MSGVWQMSKQLLLWMLGQPEEMQCKDDWLLDNDDEENEMEQESSGVGTAIAICMALMGLGFAAYLIPSPLTQGATRSNRREQRENERNERRAEPKLKAVSSDPFEEWQDVLLPHGEEFSWLMQAQQHNLRCACNDCQPLLQLQLQLEQPAEKFYDIPDSKESDEEEPPFKELENNSSQLDLSGAVQSQ